VTIEDEEDDLTVEGEEEEEEEQDECTIGLDCEIRSDVVAVTPNASSSANRSVVVPDVEVPGGGDANATCDSGLMVELSGSDRVCQAGCCVDGACECHDGFHGARCEVELRCGTSADGDRWDLEACGNVLVTLDARRAATCSCSSLGFVAVLAHRLVPASALLDALGSDWPGAMRAQLRLRPYAVLLPALLYALVMGGAWLLDQRTLYTTATPAWAQPGARGFPLRRQLMYTVRTRGTLLRPWHVVPGRTIYTRVQLAHSLMVSLVLIFVGSVLFLQAQQCSALSTYVAGAAGGLLSSLPALFGRLFFKYSRDPHTRRVYKALSVERKEQFALGVTRGHRARMCAVNRTQLNFDALGSAPVQPCSPTPRGGLGELSSGKGDGRGPTLSELPSPRQSSTISSSPRQSSTVGAPATAPCSPSSRQSSVVRLSAVGRQSTGALIGDVAPPPGVAPPALGSRKSGSSDRRTGSQRFWAAVGRSPSSMSDGRSSRRSEGPRPEPEDEVLLDPSQLTLMADGLSIGFRATKEKGDEEIVPATHVGVPWRYLRSAQTVFAVRYELRTLRALGVTPGDVRALAVDASGARSAGTEVKTPAKLGGANWARGAACNAAVREQVIRRQMQKRGQMPLTGEPPPLSRGSWSWRQGMAWAYGATVLVLGWWLVLLVSLVAAPRSCARRGVDEGSWWRRSIAAWAGGVLTSMVLLDALKVIMLTLTGPALLMRISSPTVRECVKVTLRPLHKLLTAIV